MPRRTRELVEVNGRPATEDEKKKAAEEDEKRTAAAGRGEGRSACEGDAAQSRATRTIRSWVRGGCRSSSAGIDDPARGGGDHRGTAGVRPRLRSRVPRRRPAKSLADRALNALEGRAIIDAVDVPGALRDARLTQPVKVAGGLAANVKEAERRVRRPGPSARESGFPAGSTCA